MGRTDLLGRLESPTHADQRVIDFLYDGIIGNGRNGVAADGDDFDLLLGHEAQNIPGILKDFCRRPRPVRVPLGIADVDDIFMRQEHPQFSDDRQSADTGVKNTDRP